MKQLLQNIKTGETEVAEVPVPHPSTGAVLIRTAASLVSAGTERMVVEFAQRSLVGKAQSRPDLVKQVLNKARREGILTTIEAAQNQLDQPLALGYSSAGTILQTGPGLQGFRVGDRVACAGGGHAVHAEFVTVPQNLMVHIPDSVDFESAAFTTVGAVALQGFRLAGVQVGAKVAVIGLGLLGLLATGIAAAAGCQVLGIELNPERVVLAKQMGAKSAVIRGEALEAAMSLSHGRGVLQCHQAQKFDTEAHHNHNPDTAGAQCVNCHMPETTYMVVDPRRDHSIRIPRPDLSVKLGVPNACTRCHTDQSNAWAVDTMHNWYGDIKPDWQDFAITLHEARRGNPAVASELEVLISNASTPAIVRATLMMEIPRYLSASSLPVIRDALKDPNPLVRQATINALSNTNPNLRLKLFFPLLDDSVRAVQLAATRALMDLPVEQLSEQQNEKLYMAITEYEKSLKVNADRPEVMVQLGVLYSVQGRYLDAEHAYQKAIKLDDHFNAAYVNLADLLARQNQEADAQAILKQGLAVLSEDPDLHHALGLSLIRSKQHDKAMPELDRAAKLAPENARYSYVYAVALHSMGNARKAITTLETALQHHPYDRQIMEALVAFYREAGEMDKAAKMAGHLQ